jgi:hypothetical protein
MSIAHIVSLHREDTTSGREFAMTTAQEIQRALRVKDQARTKRRAAAVRELVKASKGVAKALDEVTVKKVAAGLAVEAALAAEFTESELHGLTTIDVADLRQWRRLAQQAGEGEAGEAAIGDQSPVVAQRTTVAEPDAGDRPVAALGSVQAGENATESDLAEGGRSLSGVGGRV